MRVQLQFDDNTLASAYSCIEGRGTLDRWVQVPPDIKTLCAFDKHMRKQLGALGGALTEDLAFLEGGAELGNSASQSSTFCMKDSATVQVVNARDYYMEVERERQLGVVVDTKPVTESEKLLEVAVGNTGQAPMLKEAAGTTGPQQSWAARAAAGEPNPMLC